MKAMTAEEVAKKFTKSDGSINIPPGIIISTPNRTPISKVKKNSKYQGDLEVIGGKLFVDGVEAEETPEGIVFNRPNRAARRAKK